MGQKAAYACIACNGFSAFLWLVCGLSTGWFDKTFHLPGTSFIGMGLNIKAGLLSFNSDATALCRNRDTDQVRTTGWTPALSNAVDNLCKSLSEESGYQGIHDGFCGDALKNKIFPQACPAIVMMRWGGIAMFIFILFTIILQIVSSGLIGYYFHKSPKKKYRVFAMGALVLAPSMCLCGLAFHAYAQSEFGQLLHMKVGILSGQSNEVAGNVSWAWIISVINVLCMFIMPFLVKILKTSAESTLKEAKKQKQFEQEMAAYAYADGGAYPDGGGGYDAYGNPVAQDPYANPAPGYGGDPYASQQQQHDPYSNAGSGYPQQGGYNY